MKRISYLIFVSLTSFALTIFADEYTSNLPTSLLTKAEVDAILADDTAENWEKYAQKSKEKAFELASKQSYNESASWMYIYCASELFSKEGKDLNIDIKRTMLLDIPALCDLFEQMKKEDDRAGFCKVLTQIYNVYPANFKKYLRSAYAVALIYDILPPIGWPVCNTPSDPVSLSQPEEVFNLFTGDSKSFVYPMDKLTIGELIWIFGVAGPIDELRSLKREKMKASDLEKVITSVKDDPKRMEKNKYGPWNTNERDFTAANIMEFGGSPMEKIYYTWRVANANGILCLYFTEKTNSAIHTWLAYMEKPGKWCHDVARDKKALPFFGRPLDPQTWKTSKDFDIKMLERRYIMTEKGVHSQLFLRMSKMLYDDDKYKESAEYAQKAITENTENWEAYIMLINALARSGATQAELDALWKKAYETFNSHPDIRIHILNLYRENLIARRKIQEANKMFVVEMRKVMKESPGLGIEIYSEQLVEMYKHLKVKTDIFPYYQDALRVPPECHNACLRKIVSPLADIFMEAGDYTSAQKVVSIFIRMTRDEKMKNVAKNLLDKIKTKAKANSNNKSEFEEEEDDNNKKGKTRNSTRRKR